MSLFEHLVDRRSKALEKISIALEGTDFFLKHEETPQKENEDIVWLKEVEVNGKKWKLEIHLTMRFPDEPPKIYVPEASTLFLTNPHIDNNGLLCTIPDSACINRDDPVGVFFCTITCAEQILSGTDLNDFKDEFSSYWTRGIKENQNSILINPPEQLHDLFDVYVDKNVFFLGQSKETLSKWLKNYSNNKLDDEYFIKGVNIKIESTLLPKEYPTTAYDLICLLKKANRNAYYLLTDLIFSFEKQLFVVISQITLSEYILGGVSFFGLEENVIPKKLNGFRKGKIPKNLFLKIAEPYLKEINIIRHTIERTDNFWLHSRGGDGILYQKKSILLIGCGSLGGYVAHLLAKAGVGNITLIDKEKLEWNNIGRHILGAESVEQFKAEALSFFIKKQMPHLQIFSIENDWREALSKNNDLFKNQDLIISTIADWKAENSLNYLSCKEPLPPIIYGWLEPFAVAGHCLICVKGSGCFACKMNKFGQFLYKVADFVNPTSKREPGNCTTYQQYGVSALFPVASLVATNALKCLLKLPIETTLKTWISDQEHFETCKAILSDEWKEKIIDQNGYSKVYTSTIYSSPKCQVCYN